MAQDEALWTIEQVATFLRVTVPSVRARVARKTIPFRKLGHLLRFPPSAIREWLEKPQPEAQSKCPGTKGLTKGHVRIRRHALANHPCDAKVMEAARRDFDEKVRVLLEDRLAECKRKRM